MAGIVRLPPEVVDRIAAGEVIQRPANALKELIENSLDAGASSIRVLVKDGGLKLLQIRDDGCGIRREDLESLCERFATSKLRSFDDLETIATHGFRGEALASISHVAHLSVRTRTEGGACAFEARYRDGRLTGDPAPCAATRGTLLTVQDLFFNTPARRKVLSGPAEEYRRIFKLVADYAVHNYGVGFSLEKCGEKVDLKTAPGSSALDNIRTVYGDVLARDLSQISLDDRVAGVKAHGFISSVNYSAKKATLLLFINHRLVESAAIKKAIESIYNTYLQKNGHPFVYLSLEIDPRNVDVNVHPTKHQVNFLHEERVIDEIKNAVEAKLLSCNSSRVLYTQARLPGATAPEESDGKSGGECRHEYAKNSVRTDPNDQKIDKFFNVSEHNESVDRSNALEDTPELKTSENDSDDSPRRKTNDTYTKLVNAPATLSYIHPSESFKTRQFYTQRNETKLTSVKNLRIRAEENCSMSLRETLANLVFVGCIDQTKSIIQYSTRMYLCNTGKLMEELFYQILLYDFQNFGYIRLSSPLSIDSLALLALENPESEWSQADGNKLEIAEKVKNILTSKGPMLLEYFSMDIDKDGNLLTLPLLLDNYMPFMGALPIFILRLATEVNWEKEKECFKTFCRETARFYSRQNPSDDENTKKTREWTHEHVIFYAIRRFFLPPKEFAENGAILQIANLPDLYKVFERC